MPPIRLKLRDMPRLQDGPAGGDDSSNVNKHKRAAAAGEPQQSSAGMAVGAGIAARTTEQLADAWRIWPVMTISAVHSAVKGWFTRMDAALLGLPRGLGPAVSSLIRLLSLAIAASIVTSVITRTSQDLLKLPSRASKAVGDPSSYTPGRHNWVAAPSRWDPHYCSVCSEAIAWNSDAGVRCQICGSHAHASCSKRAHKEGFGCKTLCSADVEMSHKRLYHPLEEAEDEDDDACLLPEPEEKPPPVMRHQWMRGSIDDSQPCAACGGSCAGSGATGQHGFSCAWCKLQVHEGCISRMAHTECSLGRHRRLILPPTAVLKDQPRKKRGLIRDAVSKVRRVLPGHREDECDPSSYSVDPNDPEAVAPATGGASAGQGAGSSDGGGSDQGSGFVEAVREAAAALDVSGAKGVGSRLAGKVRDAGEKVLDAGFDVAAGLDVAGDSAKEGGRRLAEKVLDAMPIELEDDVWEEALKGEGYRSVNKDVDDDGGGGDGDTEPPPPATSIRESEVDGVWEEALSLSAAAKEEEGESPLAGDAEGERTAAGTAVKGLAGGDEASSRRGGQSLRPRPAAGEETAEEAVAERGGDERTIGWSSEERGSPGIAADDGDGDQRDVDGDGDGQGRGESGGAWVSGKSADGEGGVGEENNVAVTAAAAESGPAGGDAPATSSPDDEAWSDSSSQEDGGLEDDDIPEGARETIVSEFVSLVPSDGGGGGGVGGGAKTTVASSEDGGGAGARAAGLEMLNLGEPSDNAAAASAVGGDPDGSGEGAPPGLPGVLEAGSVGQKPEYQEVGGVGVAGWGKDGEGAAREQHAGGATGGGEKEDGMAAEEEDEEEEEEEEQEWVVKMQELVPKFQTSGEGAEATTTVSYTRKTRSVTLSICEENIPDDSCPLLVFVNSKSGGKQGGVLISRFRALLNPLQVIDLSQEDPLEVLQRFRNVANLRLLACGGDGTVAWLLQSVDAITWKVKRPPLAILPLGTGNDLARVLGWGGGYTGEDVENLLDTIENAQVTMLDRWSVSVVTTSKGFRKGQKDRQLIMNNYLGIGVDGQVALDFHKMREARPVLFFNRLFNKALYAQLGVRSALVRACHDLPSRIELRCDGQLVDLPATTASIIACNINSYGGGSKLWAVEERNRRTWAGRTSNHPLSYPQSQQQRTTMWGFDTGGLVNPGGSLPSGGAGGEAAAVGNPEAASPWGGGGGELPRTPAAAAAAVTAGENTRLRRFRTRLGGGGIGREGMGSGRPPPLAAVSVEGGSAGEEESWGGGGAAGESSDSDEGRWEKPRDSRGSSSKRRESKTSFHDGVLEVVAVEGVLHLGQIQLGLSRALAVAQCREMQVKSSATLPMQVDGEPWKQPPSEITVKLHNQAAMLRPATTTERAVASVLNDVSSAIHGAEEDLVINERQARTLLSRIRRSTRLPE